jgi:hypothetical protein
MSTTSDKLAHTFDMDVKISAKKKSGNVIAYTPGSRQSSENSFDPVASTTVTKRTPNHGNHNVCSIEKG